MASANNSVESLKNLLDAVRNDDVPRLKFLLLINPKILDLAAKFWPEHPLIAVCKMRSFGVIEEIRIQKPGFARLKDDKDCHALLHWSCVRGDAEMVKVLVDLDSQLCCVCLTELSMIPLQTAVIHGRLDVIRELLRARPESLETLTSLKESALHLAAKFYQPEAFMFLLKELRPDQRHLLYGLDSEGSSALEIATVNNLITEEVLQEEQLLWVEFDLENSRNQGRNLKFISRWAVLRKKYKLAKFTQAWALSAVGRNVHEAVFCEELGTESDRYLQEVALREEPGTPFEDIICEQQTNFNSESHLIINNHPVLEVINLNELEMFPNGIRGCNSRWWLFEKRKFMLIFPAILLSLGFISTLILPYFFPREKSVPNNQVVFQFTDMVTRHLPPVFYIMTLITIVLTTSSINLTKLLFSLPFGSLLFLCGFSTFAIYVLLTYRTMPRFFVRIGSHDVSSFQVMWTLALGLVFLVAVIYLLVKYCFHKPILRMKNLLKLVLADLCFLFTVAPSIWRLFRLIIFP